MDYVDILHEVECDAIGGGEVGSMAPLEKAEAWLQHSEGIRLKI